MALKDKETYNAYQKAWRTANKEKLKRYADKWRAKNPDRVKAAQQRYREANRDRIRQYQKSAVAVERDRLRAQTPERKAQVREYHKRYYAENRNKILARSKERRFAQYALTRSAFAAMLDTQNNKCAICQTTPKVWNIDHDHKTGKVRGLLCNPCNIAIGLLKDSPQFCLLAAKYLEKYNKS